MARIALIKCSLPPAFNLLVTPPLGILSIASVLREQGHPVRVLDLRLSPGNTSWIEEELLRFSPDVVGLSALTQESESMHRLAALSKRIPGVAAVVCGGPHPSAYPEEVLGDPHVDSVVCGEGEDTAVELIDCLEAGRVRETVPGTLRRGNGELARGGPRPYVEDVDRLPFPAWDLIDIGAYARAKRMGNLPRRKYMAVMTSRGCPYRCIYCHHLFGREFRARSPEHVVRELDILHDEFGIKEFEIIDDIFNLDPGRMYEILDRIRVKNWGARLAFPNGLRGDLLDPNSLRALKSAGTYFLALAVETASPRLQEVVGKRLDLGKIRHTIQECRRMDLTSLGFFMLGFPTETPAEARTTVEWACSSPLDFASFFIAAPFQGTRMAEYHQPDGEGRPGFAEFDFHRGGVNLSEIPDRELFALQREAYRLGFSAAPWCDCRSPMWRRNGRNSATGRLYNR